jgi:hypothetical protein
MKPFSPQGFHPCGIDSSSGNAQGRREGLEFNGDICNSVYLKGSRATLLLLRHDSPLHPRNIPVDSMDVRVETGFLEKKKLTRT